MLYFKKNIPEDWQIVKIKDIIKDYQQGFASGARDDNGIIQLRMNNITTDGRVILDTYLKVPIPENIDRYLLQKDDVIFNNTNSVKLIGKTAIFDDESNYCTFSNHLTRLRADKLKVIPYWLLYHFNQAWRWHYFKRICNTHVNQAGIKREDIHKVFDKFSQIERVYKDSIGTGLGMSITKSIIECLGGKIWIESQIGKGTTVSFTLAKRKQDSP